MRTVKIMPTIAVIGIALIVLITVLSGAASALSAAKKGARGGFEDFSRGWLDENGDEVSLSKITKSCVLHKQIPKTDFDRAFCFNARNLDVDVYIGDECVYKTEKTDDPFLKALYGKTAGSEFIEVKISHYYSGKTLYLDITNPYSNGNACKIVNMLFGDGVEIVKYDASIQLGTFCFSIVIVFIGVLCILVYFPMAKHKMIDSSMLYLGLSALTFGMVMVTDSKLLHLIVGHESLYYTVSQMFMSVIPIPLLLFFGKLYDNLNKKLIAALCIANILDFAAVLTLNALGVFDFHDNAVITLLICALSIGYIGIITVVRLIKRDRDKLFHNLGVIMIAVFSLLDVLLANKNPLTETSFFTRFGVAGFTCMECVQVLWKHIENYQKGVKAQLVSRLAYHDGLTDMLNRTSFMEDTERLESGKHDGLVAAVFDVNGLKYVNDNFGHADGDELIMNVAAALKKAFDGIGKCYRTGGDEFVFISEDSGAEDRFLEAQKTLYELLDEYSGKYPYPVSVAAGYSVTDDRPVKETLVTADEKMYENKRQTKDEYFSRSRIAAEE